eukprot:TRINITY_DN3238_c0_g1_i1.p1 TRINITY_DN3238_c0_g1~~TRINITY_DN3238_c0_g1_i1.p1  ORF type:complete len:311 (-),score=45.78 TRINITY_DN3238_c0_g1_i1:176-1108(-)
MHILVILEAGLMDTLWFFCENFEGDKSVLFIEESNSKLWLKKQIHIDRYNFVSASPVLAVGHNWFSLCDIEADPYIAYKRYVDPGRILKYTLENTSEYITSDDPHNYERFGVAMVVTVRYTAYFSLFLDNYGKIVSDKAPKIGIKYDNTQMPTIRPVPPLIPSDPVVRRDFSDYFPQFIFFFALFLSVGCCLIVWRHCNRKKNNSLTIHNQNQTNDVPSHMPQAHLPHEFDKSLIYEANTEVYGFNSSDSILAFNLWSHNQSYNVRINQLQETAFSNHQPQQPQMQVANGNEIENFVYLPPPFNPDETLF